MTQYLVLSAEHAEAVRGESSPGHILNPVPLTDGRYVLPLRVLEAPEHEGRRAFLMTNASIEEVDQSLIYVRQSRRPQ